MRTTIKEVAQHAGVSASTVSLVLNNPDAAISEKTRERVMQVVRELRYRPNRLAVSLATKKTNTIGLIIPDNSNFFLVAYSNRLEATMSEFGYTMILGNANNSLEKTLHYLYDFSDRGVDAIILMQSVFASQADTETCMDAIKDLQVPIALVDRFPKNHPASIRVNDFLGGYLAFKHLLDLGHKRIGIITGEMHLHNCIERLGGCKKALDEAGIPFDPALLYEGDFQIASGTNALPYLLGKNVTAIFAFNDMIAYGVYKELRNYNLSIPGDISVVGFDDIPFSDVICPPLTTIEYPLNDIAATVIDRLIKAIQGKEVDTLQAATFDPVLKVKGSTRRLSDGE